MDELITTWRASSFCGDAACVEVATPVMRSGIPVVPVRWTKEHSVVAFVPLSEWQRRVAAVLNGGRLRFDRWFPASKYGQFAHHFSGSERRAFRRGVAAGEFNFT